MYVCIKFKTTLKTTKLLQLFNYYNLYSNEKLLENIIGVMILNFILNGKPNHRLQTHVKIDMATFPNLIT